MGPKPIHLTYLTHQSVKGLKKSVWPMLKYLLLVKKHCPETCKISPLVDNNWVSTPFSTRDYWLNSILTHHVF
jgi:hypothetical protein